MITGLDVAGTWDRIRDKWSSPKIFLVFALRKVLIAMMLANIQHIRFPQGDYIPSA
ncbi:hypothetical protein LTR91_026516, partial [Friedmanniomyces endolithicus]